MDEEVVQMRKAIAPMRRAAGLYPGPMDEEVVQMRKAIAPMRRAAGL